MPVFTHINTSLNSERYSFTQQHYKFIIIVKCIDESDTVANTAELRENTTS